MTEPDRSNGARATIWLEEFSSVRVDDLDEEDLRVLVHKYPQAISASRDPLAGVPRLTASSWIGVIKLPSGREVRITTKVPVANVFYMLAMTRNWPFRPQDLVGYAPDASILSVVARFFRDQLVAIDDGGLYRGYAGRIEDLTVIRGRIDFRKDLQSNLIERQRTACAFSEFTRDIPENQILRQTARRLADCGLVQEFAGDFNRLDYWWSDVARTDFEPETALGFVYHRMNEHYRVAHELAAVLLQWLSPGGSHGTQPFPAFLANMNDLYEDFVRCVLAGALRQAKVHKPAPLLLDQVGRVRFRPDLLFIKGGQPVLVGDCKYKRIAADPRADADIYQMVSYCTALGLDTGLLIFPRHLVDVSDELVIRGSGTRIKRLTINLGMPVSQMPGECTRLGHGISSFL